MDVCHQATLAGQPALEVSDIFRRFGHLLEPLASSQAKVIWDLKNCRTEVLGGHKLCCGDCGHVEFSYNSCRNRHCPKCQFLAKLKWIAARLKELLPVQYFHCVFTLPHVLNPLLWCNKRLAFQILFRATSETLKEVGARRLKAELGFTSVLHTWGQTLTDHAHIHAIVPGGGVSLDGKRWVSTPQDYLLPLKVMAKVFRGKFLDYLEQSYPKLIFPGNCAKYKNPKVFKSLLIQAAKKNWIVYAKAPFLGPKQVIEYLGNYTHRIAISNRRILSLGEDHVTFRYQDRSQNNKPKTMTLKPKEFMRRFLLHTLPTKFVRIRHYGLLGSRDKQRKLNHARKLLGARQIEKIQIKVWQDLLPQITTRSTRACPKCKTGALIEVAVLLPHPALRGLGLRKNTS